LNYAAIYRRFVESRRKRVFAPGDCTEVHHIIPRSLGGSDDASNLVRLSAADHLFAHILLAKIHGGWMISAVFLMSGGKGHLVGKPRRATYAALRKKWGEYSRTLPGLKGATNGNHNPHKFDWVNLDSGDKRTATLAEMWSCFGGNRGGWTMAAMGGRRTMLGWCLTSATPRIRGLKGKFFRFVNRDGRIFEGTQKQFCDAIGASYAAGSRVCRDRSVTACGWRLDGVEDRPHTAMKHDGRPAREGAGKVFRLEKGGRSFLLRRKEAAAITESTLRQFSSGAHFAIHNHRTYKGWSIAEVEAVNTGRDPMRPHSDNTGLALT